MRRAGTVIEDMAKVRITTAAPDLRTSMKKLSSGSVATFSAAAGAVKLGQPVPESYFSSERNSGAPQHIHW